MKVYKGYKNSILSRDFVNFSLSHPVAKEFLEFLKDAKISDELFFPTLSRIEKIEEVDV